MHLTTSKSAAEGCSNFNQKPSILNSILFIFYKGFPGGEVVKNPHANAGDPGSIPGLGRSPGVGNGNPLWYSCLENPRDRGAWWATVHGVTMSHTTCAQAQPCSISSCWVIIRCCFNGCSFLGSPNREAPQKQELSLIFICALQSAYQNPETV